MQSITGRAVAQIRIVPIAGGTGRHKARQALAPNGASLFVAADTIDPKPFRKAGPKAWSKGKTKSFCNLRLSGLRKLIQGRHNGPCDTNDGESYFVAALPHLVAKAWAYEIDEDRIRSREWAETWTPNLYATMPVTWFREQEQLVLLAFDNRDGRPSLPSADDFARALGITDAEVKAYGLRTIGAIDRLAEQRLADERKADRAYQARKREVKGAMPRGASTTAREPWKAYGISRASYYRWLRKTNSLDETNSSGEMDSSEAKVLVPDTPFPDLAPAVAVGQLVPANDDAPRVGPVTAPDGWRLQASDSDVGVALGSYPELASNIDAHVDAVMALMIRTPASNRWRVVRNLMKDRGRTLRRSMKAAA